MAVCEAPRKTMPEEDRAPANHRGGGLLPEPILATQINIPQGANAERVDTLSPQLTREELDQLIIERRSHSGLAK